MVSFMSRVGSSLKLLPINRGAKVTWNRDHRMTTSEGGGVLGAAFVSVATAALLGARLRMTLGAISENP